MSTIDELRQQCHARYEEYEDARSEWIESEAKLALAIQDEQTIQNNDRRARKMVFFACLGMTVVTMLAKWWKS